MPHEASCALTATQAAWLPLAQTLGQQLNLPVLAHLNAQYENWLLYTEVGLALYSHAFPAYKPLRVDFLQTAFIQRLKKTSTRTELLAKAVGIKKNYIPTVIDATAGLGQDAIILAQLGCTVTLLERSTIVFALLQDGLQRFFSAYPNSKNFILQLIHIDANTYLAKLNKNHLPDVIYLDPMFPKRQHSALAKKEMRLLRHIVGGDTEADKLLALALTHAKKRVVVKRARLAPYLGHHKPTFSIQGKQQRLDIYLIFE